MCPSAAIIRLVETRVWRSSPLAVEYSDIALVVDSRSRRIFGLARGRLRKGCTGDDVFEPAGERGVGLSSWGVVTRSGARSMRELALPRGLGRTGLCCVDPGRWGDTCLGFCFSCMGDGLDDGAGGTNFTRLFSWREERCVEGN